MNAAVDREADPGADAEPSGPPRAGAPLGGDGAEQDGAHRRDQQQHPVVLRRGAVALLRVAEPQEKAQPDGGSAHRGQVDPPQLVVEPGAQDEDEEDDLRDHDRLHGRQVPEAEGEGLEDEAPDRQSEARVPDRPFQNARHQVVAPLADRPGGLDTEALEDRREGVRDRSKNSQQKDHFARYSRSAPNGADAVAVAAAPTTRPTGATDQLSRWIGVVPRRATARRCSSDAYPLLRSNP